MLRVPSGASAQLRETIETINFLAALPDGSDIEVSADTKPVTIYRTEHDIISVTYSGFEGDFVTLLAIAVREAGYSPKVHEVGLHYSLAPRRQA